MGTTLRIYKNDPNLFHVILFSCFRAITGQAGGGRGAKIRENPRGCAKVVESELQYVFDVPVPKITIALPLLAAEKGGMRGNRGSRGCDYVLAVQGCERESSENSLCVHASFKDNNVLSLSVDRKNCVTLHCM